MKGKKNLLFKMHNDQRISRHFTQEEEKGKDNEEGKEDEDKEGKEEIPSMCFADAATTFTW